MNIENKNLRILIVDDVPENLDILSRSLEQQAYNVLVATSGEMALKVADRTRPDLILLDIMMPGIDGFETCRRLKASADTQDIPVIFLTAWDDSDGLLEGFRAGGVDYITKPFQKEEVLIRIRTHLQIHLLQASLKHSLNEIDRMHREQEAFLRHELNNRITPIIGYAEMLFNTDDGSFGEQRLKWIRTVYDSAQDISDLVDDLKQLHDFEADRFDLHRTPADLLSLVHRVADDLKTVYGDQANIRIQNELKNSTVHMDPNLIIGVFQNLIKNAIEHVSDLPDEAEREVKVHLGNEGAQAVVRIHNGGEPVPPDKLASFFEKFNTGKKERGGTGLGTTYAYLVTTAHGGLIDVTSSPEGGTTLTVQLPLE